MAADDQPTLLRAVDRAALAASFGERLRRAGASVPMTAMADLCEALGQAPPSRLDDLYWSMRLTLVRRQPDLDTFDKVFAAAFREADLGADPHARRSGPTAFPPAVPETLTSVPGGGRGLQEGEAAGLPWQMLPRSTAEDETSTDPVVLPELLPSALSG